MDSPSTHEECIARIEALRWPDGPTCPYCHRRRSTAMRPEQRHHCNACKTSFSVTVGTVFHRTRLPLEKWLAALFLMLETHRAPSVREFSQAIGVSKDTASRMVAQIRMGLADPDQRDLLRQIASTASASATTTETRRAS